METISSFLRKRGLYLLLLLIILLLLILRTCERQPPERPVVFSDPVKAPVAIAFLDANRLLSKQISRATVTLNDPGGMVVSSNGLPFKTIEVTGGVMSLALKQTAVIGPDSIYRFTVNVISEGYSSNSRNILIRSDEGQYVPIFLAKLNDPPAGMATLTGSAALSGGALNTGATLVPNVSNGVSTDNIKVDIPPGTQPIYCESNKSGTPFPDSLNFRISYASPISAAASRTFPGGQLITDAVDIDGTVLARPDSLMYFITAGFMNLEMDVDGNQVNGFTKPVSVTMPIPDNLENPQEGRPYEENDQIDLWSFNERGAWRKEGVATVKGSAGNLRAEMTITHLSTWNMDFKLDVCGSSATLTYTNAQPSSLTAYTQILTSPGEIPLSSRNFTFNAGGGTHTIINMPNSGDMQMQIFQDGPGSPPGAISNVFSCTSLNPTLNLTGGVTPQVNVEFQAKASEGAATASPICQNTVWYRRCIAACSSNNCATDVTNRYNFGGILEVSGPVDDRVGRTTIYSLTPFTGAGNEFCIRLWYAGFNGVTLVEQTVDFLFSFDDTTSGSITGRKTEGGVTSNLTISHSFNAATSTYLFELINTGPSAVTPLTTCPI